MVLDSISPHTDQGKKIVGTQFLQLMKYGRQGFRIPYRYVAQHLFYLRRSLVRREAFMGEIADLQVGQLIGIQSGANVPGDIGALFFNLVGFNDIGLNQLGQNVRIAQGQHCQKCDD